MLIINFYEHLLYFRFLLHPVLNELLLKLYFYYLLYPARELSKIESWYFAEYIIYKLFKQTGHGLVIIK